MTTVDLEQLQDVEHINAPVTKLPRSQSKLLGMLKHEFGVRQAMLPPAMEQGDVRVIHMSFAQHPDVSKAKIRVQKEFCVTWPQLVEHGYPANAHKRPMGNPTLYVVTDRGARRLLGLHLSMETSWLAARRAVLAIKEIMSAYASDKVEP